MYKINCLIIIKHREKSCYSLVNDSNIAFEEKEKIGKSIIIPYIQIFDTFHYMNEVVNVVNKEKVDFWSLEEHYNPIETLFLLCKIKDEDHKDILFNLVYTMASKRIGDKDFEARAEEILKQMKETIISLSETLADTQK